MSAQLVAVVSIFCTITPFCAATPSNSPLVLLLKKLAEMPELIIIRRASSAARRTPVAAEILY
jgi:hypothetical protein